MPRSWFSLLVLAGLAIAITPKTVRAAADCVPKDIFFTNRVNHRNPGERLGARAANLEKLYLYVAMDCMQVDAHETFRVTWSFNGKRVQALDIPLGSSPNWRTSAYATARRGKWQAALSWANGALFATEEITVE
jgi:hypothetical protein